MVMKRNPRPCFNRVLVRIKPLTSPGGLVVIPDAANVSQFATQDAYIVAMGDSACVGAGTGKLQYKVGDCVKINKYSGEDDRTIEDGELYRIINDDDVLNVWEGEGLNDR